MFCFNIIFNHFEINNMFIIRKVNVDWSEVDRSKFSFNVLFLHTSLCQTGFLATIQITNCPNIAVYLKNSRSAETKMGTR